MCDSIRTNSIEWCENSYVREVSIPVFLLWNHLLNYLFVRPMKSATFDITADGARDVRVEEV